MPMPHRRVATPHQRHPSICWLVVANLPQWHLSPSGAVTMTMSTGWATSPHPQHLFYHVTLARGCWS
jgi:hypothetical protein